MGDTEQPVTGSAAQPEVDVIIAVHQPTRPIQRAVGSVLDHTKAQVRVTVVVHNTEPGPLRERLSAYAGDPRLRVVEYRDGIASPAGPMNHGFDLATAPYTSLIGSDDTLEPGALDAWLAAARAVASDGRVATGRGADMVIAPTRDEYGVLSPSPPIRVKRGAVRVLDPSRDRLAYRSAPLGLIGRAKHGALRFPEKVATGEDQPFAAQLWFAGGTTVFPITAPGYREHHDQDDRVTFTPRSVTEEFKSLDALLDPQTPWMRVPAYRLALCTKLVRANVMDALRIRLGEAWTVEAAKQLAEVTSRLLTVEPGVRAVLSRAEVRLLDAIADPATGAASGPAADASELSRLLAARSSLRSAAALLPQKLRHVLHPQAPLRFHLARVRLQRAGRRAAA